MKYGFLIAALAILGSANARAGQTLTCFTDDARYQLTVDYSTDKPTAQVTHDGTPAMFGDLQCRQSDESETLLCSSHGVADAGYNAVISTGSKSHVARLGEIWIGGERPLGQMTCDW